MALTDPFPADVETWLQESIQHLFKVQIRPVSGPWFDVAVVGRHDLTYDMDWSPFAQVSLTIKTPQDPTQLAALDSRLGTKVFLQNGYRYGGVDYWKDMALLRLHSISSPHPGGTTDLTAHGAEMVPQERHAPVETATSYDGYVDRSGLDPFIRSWIRRGHEPYGPYPAVVSTIPGGAWNVGLVSGWKSSGGTYWDGIDYAAKSAALRVYDAGLGTWYIEGLPGLGTDYAGRFRDGKRGTITGADNSVDRERWYNQVSLQYDYINGSGQPSTIGGYARVTSGPYAANGSNTREYFEHITVPWNVSQEAATARAQYLLGKFMLRGRQRSFTAAAAYWLRPGMTILVKLGRAKYDRVLVAAVTFSPLAGSMTVRTVRPEDYETS